MRIGEIKLYWIGLTILMLMAGCGGAQPAKNTSSGDTNAAEVASTSKKCPDDYQTAPYAKVTNQGFLSDYEGCKVSFDAVFGGPVDIGGLRLLPSQYQAHVTVSFAGPDTTPTGINPLAGGTDLLGLVEKGESDFAFSIAKGTPVTAKGVLEARHLGTGSSSVAEIYFVVHEVIAK
jgi:hypothetical protein